MCMNVEVVRTRNGSLRGKVFEKRFAQAFLLFGRELSARRGEIKNVDGRFAFRFDQGDIDVALLVRKSRADSVQQAGPIRRNDFHERAVGGASIVKLNLRR